MKKPIAITNSIKDKLEKIVPKQVLKEVYKISIDEYSDQKIKLITEAALYAVLEDLSQNQDDPYRVAMVEGGNPWAKPLVNWLNSKRLSMNDLNVFYLPSVWKSKDSNEILPAVIIIHQKESSILTLLGC